MGANIRCAETALDVWRQVNDLSITRYGRPSRIAQDRIKVLTERLNKLRGRDR